jgi:hypothetical protein
MKVGNNMNLFKTSLFKSYSNQSSLVDNTIRSFHSGTYFNHKCSHLHLARAISQLHNLNFMKFIVTIE